MDQIFAMKILVEKCLEKDRKLFAAFMDLEKAYDRGTSTGGAYGRLRECMGWEGNCLRESGPSMRMQVPLCG